MTPFEKDEEKYVSTGIVVAGTVWWDSPKSSNSIRTRTVSSMGPRITV